MHKSIIGLAGPKYSGKTSAALALVEQGFIRVSFAEPLKLMIEQLLKSAGLSAEAISIAMTEQKEQVIPCLSKSPRELMQTLGTEWGRQLVDADLWLNLVRNRMASSANDYWVFDNVRFENEADFIRELGGLIIHIDRTGDELEFMPTPSLEHISEQRLMNHYTDEFVENDGDFATFIDDVNRLVTRYIQ